MLSDDPLWYKDAIIYELHVRAFCDSVGDGCGDFRGLTQKLDHLQDLGVTAIWLLPFYPSPLRDDGYDIADYTSINPQYGDLTQFKEFLDAAHERSLRVITELVVNHTSDQHPWFQRARRAPPGSVERDFYVWSDTPDKYRDARIIFKDFETSNWAYDHVAQAYYWHRFYSHQPDLNFDNPAVWEALLPVVDFWFGMGVDGMRLDAIPYLFEREGTNCENLPETHVYLKALRKHVDEKFPNRMLLAEANQWPEDAVAYFGDADECHMSFHFPVMPRLFMAMHMEDRFPVIDILDQTPAIPATAQWALFLRNHDELTLEMVTDEERDYMYRAYAHERHARVNLGIRRRLAPLLGNNRRRIELMNGLLFSLPGTPVLYYGDEIGMGDNIYLGDRNGVRTPMQWSPDRNAGFSKANPQKLYLPIIIDPEYHYEAINVEAQQNNASSLLWWTKRLIGQRKLHKAFGRGTIEFLHPENRRILSFVREYEETRILVVANLSRFVQYVELDLSKYAGAVPVELFGGTAFPRIGTNPYLLTLAPHSFYWFTVPSPAPVEASQTIPTMGGTGMAEIPDLWVSRDWEKLFDGPGTRQLESALRQFILRHDLPGHAHGLRSVSLRETFRVPCGETSSFIALLDLDFARGGTETRLMPLAFASAEAVAAWGSAGSSSGSAAMPNTPRLIARIIGPKPGVLYDAFSTPAFREAILQAFADRATFNGSEGGAIHASQTRVFSDLRGTDQELLTTSLFSTEQTNTSIRYGHRFVLKTFGRIQEGVNPEVELGRYLTEEHPFAHAAPLAGVIEYRRRGRESMALMVLHGFVANEGDAWQHTLDHLSVFYERVATQPPLTGESAAPLHRLLTDAPAPPTEAAAELIHGYLDMVGLLGRRLGELHLALASSYDRPDLAPLPISGQYQRSVYQSMRNVLFNVSDNLGRFRDRIPAEMRDKAAHVRKLQPLLLKEFHTIIERRIHGECLRGHADCHLHQVLSTGKDFVFIDFEGRPKQSLGERRLKRSPLRDVIGLLRSFDYAAYAALFGLSSGRGQAAGMIRQEDRPNLLPWAAAWRHWVHDAFLRGYFGACNDSSFLPADAIERQTLFRVLLLEKLLQETYDELHTRPAWLDIPLSGLLEALGENPQPKDSPASDARELAVKTPPAEGMRA